MPLCTLHLLALHSTTPNPLLTFLSTLKSSNISPLVVSRVVRWVILPSTISTSHLLARNIHWDILLILPNTDALPPNLERLVEDHWHITAGVPSRLVKDFEEKNHALLSPDAESVPKLSSSKEASTKRTTDSAQHLELSSELDAWINEFVENNGKEGGGAVSMFNLLSFNPGMKEEYLKYGKAFAESIGSAHGGNAKIVGSVTSVNGHAVPPSTTTASAQPSLSGVTESGEIGGNWDEVALAHYPSIRHFRDMLTSEAYQEVNQRHRVPSLRDTAILMTSEVAVADVIRGGAGAKL